METSSPTHGSLPEWLDGRTSANAIGTADQSLEARIERLGRERPPVFKYRRSEVGFVFSIVMSQFLTEFFVSGFAVLLPTLVRELEIPQASSVWPATGFSLAIASTLLVFGRLGDMCGGRSVFFLGLGWLLVWTIIAGFSFNPLMLNLCRVLQGFGAAAVLPTGVMLLGSTYRPGPRKNMVFALYGTGAVLGFFGGIVIAGTVGQYLRWGYYFWIGGMFTVATLTISMLSIPHSTLREELPKPIKMDYAGAFSALCGLALTIFAITQSAHASAGWKTPYIPTCFTIGLLSLLAFCYIEKRVSDPLLPMTIFTVPAMTPLLFALMLLYGTWGIFSVYGTLYFQNIWAAAPLQVAAWYIPLGVTGLVFSVLEGFVLHLVPGRLLLVISGFGALGSQLLLALMPLTKGSYWAWTFPATVLSTIGIDLFTILMTVFITSKVPVVQQGLAGGLLNSVLQLGVALTLGVADIVQSFSVENCGLAKSYKNTFWLGVATSTVSLVVLGLWGRIPKATSGLTFEERELLVLEVERQLRHDGCSGASYVTLRCANSIHIEH